MTGYAVYRLYADGGRFLGYTQAASPEAAIAKWLRLYGETAIVAVA